MVTDLDLLGFSCFYKGYKYNFFCIIFFNFVYFYYRRRFYFLDLFVLFGVLSLSWVWKIKFILFFRNIWLKFFFLLLLKNIVVVGDKFIGGCG